jgi:hypothetical protein
MYVCICVYILPLAGHHCLPDVLQSLPAEVELQGAVCGTQVGRILCTQVQVGMEC